MLDLWNRKQRKQQREMERAYTQYTLDAKNSKSMKKELNRIHKNKGEPDPEWYKPVGYFSVSAGALVGGVFVQYAAMTLHNLFKPENARFSFFHAYGVMQFYIPIALLATLALTPFVYKKCKAQWLIKNAIYIDEDMEDRPDDAYIRTIDHMALQLNVCPDTGLGFDGHASTLMSHIMVSNKGIKKVKVPAYDPNVDGFVKRDAKGDIVYETKPLFDEALQEKLFDMKGVPKDYRIAYPATDYTFNPYDKKTKKWMGGYGRKHYRTLADAINGDFFPLPTETARPAGVYFYDNRAVNTVLAGITRSGKGQTYIEPCFDVWTRERQKWNIFTTDPKEELIGKFYYPSTVRGYEVIQFNLMNPNLTNTFNPLINALQQFRRNNDVKGSALIDGIVETLWPDNGEIWNPAAGNMFRRTVYMLFSIYIDQEKYIRYMGYKEGADQALIEEAVNENYAKITLFNVYSLVGELAAKTSSDVEFINPAVPPEELASGKASAPLASEKDFLTLAFDAMELLPTNNLRSLAIAANNAIKLIAPAPQTIAGVCASLMTGLSTYADATTRALMSGSLVDSFDVGGLAFPRRFGIQFADAFVQTYRITKEIAHWSCYRDSAFTDRLEGSDFEHEERISPSNWTWCYLKGIFEAEQTYLKCDILTDGAIAKTFYFRFDKGYKTSDGISYAIDPVTKQKVVSGGVLVELDPTTKKPHVSTYQATQMDYAHKKLTTGPLPIILSTQVYYSERPKFIFAITPPHLQQYQRHVLVIIKQIIDEIYADSYVTKQNRKPIVGTRLMLEEFGNIRAGDQGIPNMDTVASIALGQDLQITFVIQSFQQIRGVYKEEAEKIIRANSSNLIYLKTNDEEMINEMVRMSGTKHVTRNQGRSVAHKLGDMITVGEPVMTYNTSVEETTALTSNDLLFLADDTPGNGVTFSQGEMAILNKLDTVLPMAAGLHTRLPQPANGTYADNTLPSSNDSDSINILENTIDGEELVRKLVGQAKISREVKKVFLSVAKENDFSINERNGELADLMMNTVLEEYDRTKGIARRDLVFTKPYHEIASDFAKVFMDVRRKDLSDEEKKNVFHTFHEQLVRCLLDKRLDRYTEIYRHKPSQNALGFDAAAVSDFVAALQKAYPRPKPLVTRHRDVMAEAAKLPSYTGYDSGDLLFDIQNSFHRDALETVLQGVLDNIPVEGVVMSPMEGKEKFEILLSGVKVGTYEQFDIGYHTDFTASPRKLCELVTKNIALNQRIQEILREG